MEKKEMDIESFLQLFMAVSYSIGQRYFDDTRLEKFLIHNNNNEYDNRTKEILSEQFRNLIVQLKIDGYIKEVFGYKNLCCILEKLNCSGITDWYGHDLSSCMVEFLYCYTLGTPFSKFKIKVGRDK